MKKGIFIIILCLIIILFNNSLAQTLTPEEKQKILTNLANPPDSLYTENSPSDAIYSAKHYQLYEAIPIILQNIWKQEPYERLHYLYALEKLNAPQTHNIVLAFIDSMEVFQFGPRLIRQFTYDNPDLVRLEYKANAATVLIYLGDYSKRQMIYDYLTEISPKFDYGYGYTLQRIIKNFSKDELFAKNELIRIAQHHPDNGDRFSAMLALDEVYGEEMVPLFIDRFINDSDVVCRHIALDDILYKYKTEHVHNIVRARALVDPDNFTRWRIADHLMANYGTPNDYALLKQVYIALPDSIFGIYYPREYLLNNYIPEVTDTNATAKQLVDSLMSFQTQCKNMSWLGDLNFSSQLLDLLNNAISKLIGGDGLGAAITIKQYQSLINEEYKDSLDNDGKFVTADGYKFLYYYPKYILERLPKLPEVKLEDSQGKLLNGGTLQYYEGSWKDAVNNYDGTFTVHTKIKTVSLRMTYAYGSQTKSNVTVGADTVVFQTVNTQLKLQDSSGAVIDTGKVQYYFNSWQTFGSTTNGVVTKELLPNNYTFRMTYATATKDKAQDVGTNPTVVFQTVPATVQLKNSAGNFMDAGTVQYYFNSWQTFGTTTNGVVTKELLPNNYSFRMNYAYASKDKAQDIGVNSTVVFQTVPATVQLKNSLGNLIDQGTAQYYSGAWRDFGVTVNGVTVKELLPNNYSFRMNYAFASKDKAQNISANPTVVFQTVRATVQLKNSLGNLIDVGTVQYYSGAWRNFGSTTNGIVSLELLPNNYSFRMTHEFISNDKAQDVGVNSTVSFSTVLCRVNVKNSQNQPVNNAMISYYSGAWRQIGLTTNGDITKELLPANLSFRAVFGSLQKDKTQNILTNNIIEIGL